MLEGLALLVVIPIKIIFYMCKAVVLGCLFVFRTIQHQVRLRAAHKAGVELPAEYMTDRERRRAAEAYTHAVRQSSRDWYQWYERDQQVKTVARAANIEASAEAELDRLKRELEPPAENAELGELPI